jgi:hypothetical protein
MISKFWGFHVMSGVEGGGLLSLNLEWLRASQSLNLMVDFLFLFLVFADHIGIVSFIVGRYAPCVALDISILFQTGSVGLL